VANTDLGLVDDAIPQDADSLHLDLDDIAG
jgi:hypothetical protein